MAADKRGGPFLEPNRVEATDVAGPTGYHPVTAYAPSDEQTAEGFRRIWDLLRQARRSAWLKGWHADLLDGRHAPYLTTAVNEVDVDHPDLNDSTPATPTGGLNVKWQASATKNSSDQTPVSAYVPFATLSTATIVGTDHVVITDTSDSDNPKRGLVSDITALVSAAPPDATYVTLTTNATLTNERTLAVGTGLDLTDGGAGNAATIDVDLNELTTATAVAADHLIFVDNDDAGTKKTTMADALVALGAAPSATATVAAASIADNVAVRGDGGSRGVQGSAFVINDVSGTNLTLTADGTVTGTLALKPADTLAVSTGPGLSLDAAQGSATPGTVDIGKTNAEAVSISRTGKTTTVNGLMLGKSSIRSDSASAGVGYATGAGGAVTQLTNKGTSVTLDAICGTITTHNAALAAGATVAFRVSNSAVAATDTVILSLRQNGATDASYALQVYRVTAGGFAIHITNITTGSLSEALEINFAVIKGVTS